MFAFFLSLFFSLLLLLFVSFSLRQSLPKPCCSPGNALTCSIWKSGPCMPLEVHLCICPYARDLHLLFALLSFVVRIFAAMWAVISHFSSQFSIHNSQFPIPTIVCAIRVFQV